MYLIAKEPESGRRGQTLRNAAVVTALIHGGPVVAVTRIDPYTPPPPAQRIAMRIVQHKAPVVPPTLDVPQPTAAKASPPPKTKPKAKQKTKAKPTPKPAPTKASPAPMPIASTPPPSIPATPAPLVVGLTLSSTTFGGRGPRLAVGNTLMGSPDAVAANPLAGPTVHAAAPAPSPVTPSTNSASAVRISAKLRRSTPPFYPPEAKHNGVEGVVVLSITITPKGEVSNAKVLRGLSARLDESALAAAKNTLWSPATLDGRPVRITRRFNVRFTLQG